MATGTRVTFLLPVAPAVADSAPDPERVHAEGATLPPSAESTSLTRVRYGGDVGDGATEEFTGPQAHPFFSNTGRGLSRG